MKIDGKFFLVLGIALVVPPFTVRAQQEPASAASAKGKEAETLLKADEILALKGHEKGISCLSYNQTGTMLASGSFDNTVRLWNPKSGKCLGVLEGHKDRPTALAFSADGKMLASASSDAVIVWDLAAKREKHRKSSSFWQTRSLVFSPDGKTLFFSGSHVKAWDLGKNTVDEIFFSRFGGYHVFRMDDGKIVAVQYGGKKGTIWRLDSEKKIGAFVSYDGIRGMACDPNRQIIATAQLEDAVRLWEVEGGARVGDYKQPGRVYTVALQPKAKILASLSTRILNSISSESSRPAPAKRSPRFENQPVLLHLAPTARTWRLEPGSKGSSRSGTLGRA
jgi:WD40 repeat protein